MVSDFVIGVLAGVVSTVVGWMPVVNLPSWLSDSSGVVVTVFGYASALGAWMPIGLTVTVVLAVLATYGVAFLIKVARIVASFATLGGGAAG